MMVRLRRRDDAISDMIGTSILLAVTVVVVAAATVALSSQGEPAGDPPRIDLVATAAASPSGVVTIRHAGGPALATDALQAVVSSSSWTGPTEPIDVLVAGGSFELGLPGHLPLGRPLAVSDRVEVLLYSKATGDLVGMASFVVAPPDGATRPPERFTVTVTDPAPGRAPEPAAGGTLHVSVVVDHSDGRKAVRRVVVDLSALGGSDAYPLHDDGTQGDSLPHDGNHSAHVPIPPQAPLGEAVLFAQAYDLDGNDRDADGDLARDGFLVDVQPAIDPGLLAGLRGRDGDGGADGDGGGDDDDGPVGLPGPQGPPGQSGGGGSGLDLGPAPVITGMSPTLGAPGTLVRLEGTGLLNLSAIVLAQEGATSGHVASFSTVGGAPAGTAVTFVVPGIGEASYVVNATRLDGAYATAPDEFTLVLPRPAIGDVTPSAARPFTQVTVTGSGFLGVAAVTLEHPTLGSVAVPWSLVDDGTITFITHPGIAAGVYDVKVTTGTRSDVADDAFEALPPQAPGDLALRPTSGRAGDVVELTGSNLGTVSRVALVNASNESHVVLPGWYSNASGIVIVIPEDAAPRAVTTLQYRVVLAGTFVGNATAPDLLSVLPSGQPLIQSFSPRSGVPFTQVHVFGQNFTNVEAVTFGVTPVYFTSSGPNELVAVTHSGLAPGTYPIVVRTSTGQDATSLAHVGLFEAKPAVQQPVYDAAVFADFSLIIVKGPPGVGSGDPVWNFIKFRLQPGWSVAASAGNTTLLYDPMHTAPDDGVRTMTQVCRDAATRTYVFSTGGNVTIPKYSRESANFDFHYTLALRNGATAATEPVYANTQNLQFHLAASDSRLEVYDHGTYPTSKDFQGCDTP